MRGCIGYNPTGVLPVKVSTVRCMSSMPNATRSQVQPPSDRSEGIDDIVPSSRLSDVSTPIFIRRRRAPPTTRIIIYELPTMRRKLSQNYFTTLGGIPRLSVNCAVARASLPVLNFGRASIMRIIQAMNDHLVVFFATGFKPTFQILSITMGHSSLVCVMRPRKIDWTIKTLFNQSHQVQLFSLSDGRLLESLLRQLSLLFDHQCRTLFFAGSSYFL